MRRLGQVDHDFVVGGGETEFPLLVLDEMGEQQPVHPQVLTPRELFGFAEPRVVGHGRHRTGALTCHLKSSR
ncbi:hypothetical protein [Amycolatopsis sp.]|uniref:hypothetical protein n=1 Tax=Amycolatopsis sp. TaxID=37632 RepID=UPI002E0B3467|nr:hypothetical protein [Amycolatopsis sp.]